MNEFRVEVPQADLDDLHARIAAARWPDAWPDATYGITVDRVRHLADRWLTLDWRVHERRLNAYPQFTTTIDGENIYFLHVRSASPDAVPLILTHGWPGSVIEFLDLIPLLTEHFHLVIPAIPGFGFAGPTRAAGWGQERVARAWASLMRLLGYERYGAQGGDWGSGISRLLAVAAPDQVFGVHVNYLPSGGTPRRRHALLADRHGRLLGAADQGERGRDDVPGAVGGGGPPAGHRPVDPPPGRAAP